MAAVSSGGIGDLEGFAGAAEKQMDDVNDLVSRSRHLVGAALPVPCAFSSASGPPLAAPLAVLAGGSEQRGTHPTTSSNDALSCCWSSSRRGLLETTTRPHPPAVFRLFCASAARQYSQGMSCLTFLLSVSEFCAL